MTIKMLRDLTRGATFLLYSDRVNVAEGAPPLADFEVFANYLPSTLGTTEALKEGKGTEE